MIDFGKLTRKRATEDEDVLDSFVGIKGNVFYVPLGEPVEGEFDEAANRELFLLLYRVLRKFTGRLSACGREKEQSANDRDGAGRGQATRTFTVETDEGEEEIIYTRLQGVDDVLDAYDELTLFGLRSRLRQSVEVDFSRIDRYLDRAVFLQDDTIYLDTMTMPREGLERFDADLVQLYCFLYDDIRAALGERDAVKPEVRAEAEKLRERHLWPAATLFGPGWAETLRELRGLFERIVQFTAYRDDAYWRYHDAVRQTLYPNERGNENGVYWGISNFCFVWEDMGHHFLRRTDANGILFADCMDWSREQGTFSRHVDVRPWFRIRLNPEKGGGGSSQDVVRKTIQLRPDAVTLLRTGWLIENEDEREKAIPQVEIMYWDDYGYKFTWSLKFDGSYWDVRAIDLNQLASQDNPYQEVPDNSPEYAETQKTLKNFLKGMPNLPLLVKAHSTDIDEVLSPFGYRIRDCRLFLDVDDLSSPLRGWEAKTPVMSLDIAKSFFRADLIDSILELAKKDERKNSGMTVGDLYRLLAFSYGLCIWDFKYKSGVEEADVAKQLAYELAAREGTKEALVAFWREKLSILEDDVSMKVEEHPARLRNIPLSQPHLLRLMLRLKVENARLRNILVVPRSESSEDGGSGESGAVVDLKGVKILELDLRTLAETYA